ncbi:M61 family metallopeptidase [Planktothrix mougeotii]|uniref:M61 family metallopeptidase n=1 Tax=Planktothrix mougeotii LEGE 06226 TaxID=1828728 RepID=A0ABR9UAE8_9CYAN|nr:M61 family metallopeptidase [Planktothrix mougeotii]MBE9143417.1 M61 family metallopeptidase [Planktothrix mougeotii LEGE 06226]
MTEATQTRPDSLTEVTPVLQYWVGMPQPESHLFEIRLQIRGDILSSSPLVLKMPVWTPGSYLVREYSRHLQDWGVCDQDGNPLKWRKVSKNHWQIQSKSATEIRVSYRIFANELSVRTNHLDSSHGYFNGAALFLYVPGYEKHPIQVTIETPKNWIVTTILPTVSHQINTFYAADFDTLVDSPFEIGTHRLYEFQVEGKSHQLAIWGEGNLNPERLLTDFQKIITAESELFGGLPYKRYLFLLHLYNQGFGGLEHKESCSLIYSRFGFRNTDKYNRFMQLVAHEFFHLWNVKRIRPKALEVFDYEQENYTSSLWFSEGTTSYYDMVIPYRAGIFDVKGFLNAIAKDITRLQTIPGRLVQPLSESSWDTWIKLYRREPHSDNNQISYYLKGELVSFLLDLLIREKQGNQRSLDDVMRQMWSEFGQPEIGFTPEQLEQVIESIAEISLSDFFQNYLYGLDELPYNQYLEPFGLQLIAETTDETPYLGCKLASEKGREIIKFVETGSPAEAAGLDIQDELLAINGFKVTSDQFQERLKDCKPGDTVELTFFHQDLLRTCQATLTSPRPNYYKIVSVSQPTPQQKRNFEGWLGCPYHNL